MINLKKSEYNEQTGILTIWRGGRVMRFNLRKDRDTQRRFDLCKD